MSNLKLYFIIGAIVIVILLSVYFTGKYKGKQYTPDTVALPPDTQGVAVPANWNPGSITDGIYNDLNNVFSLHSSQPYDDALALSNSQLVAVFNDWNQRYFNSFGKQTLIQAIQGDETAWNYSWVTATNTLVTRLKSLGL